jgi:hypothetical protein
MRHCRRTLVMGAMSAIVLAGVGVSSAGAAPLTGCTGSGRVLVDRVSSTTTQTAWRVDGSGSCPIQVSLPSLFNPVEPTTVAFAGAGTSDTLGLCDRTLLVRNLSLLVTVTFTGVSSGKVVTETEHWSAPVTTFPFVTPFLISGVDGNPPTLGAGLAFSRIFLGCGNDGLQPSANFAWAQL